jgi:protein disulfide-isomerase-like protein
MTMKIIALFTFTALIQCATGTVYFTKEDFHEKTVGKKALVAFKAPWCGHCKKLKPVWDELSEKVEIVVGEVDCTVEKDLCSKHGVTGYPTIKYSTGHGWKKYDSGRTLEAFETFVDKQMQDGCLDDEELCSEADLLKLEEFKNLSVEDIHRRLDNNKESVDVAELLFKDHVERLQASYKTLTDEKSAKLGELTEEESWLRYVLNLQKEEL